MMPSIRDITKRRAKQTGSLVAVRMQPDQLAAVDAWIGPRQTVVEGVRAAVDGIEASGSGWTFAKLTIANSEIREIAAAAG